MMKRTAAAAIVLGVLAIAFALWTQPACADDASAKTDAPLNADASSQADTPVKPAADRVVVMYFHRTQRCPTCLKMGSYSEEAVKKGFSQQIKAGKVEFHYIDFQDKKNETLANGYNITGPTLIVAQVIDNKVKERKNLKDMWAKVGDKDAFIEYVQAAVKNYMKKTGV